LVNCHATNGIDNKNGNNQRGKRNETERTVDGRADAAGEEHEEEDEDDDLLSAVKLLCFMLVDWLHVCILKYCTLACVCVRM
jgi:hypothetical protein